MFKFCPHCGKSLAIGGGSQEPPPEPPPREPYIPKPRPVENSPCPHCAGKGESSPGVNCITCLGEGKLKKSNFVED